MKNAYALILAGTVSLIGACRSRDTSANIDTVYPKQGVERKPNVPVIYASKPGQVVFECDDLKVTATTEDQKTIDWGSIIGTFPIFDALISGELKKTVMKDVGTRLELTKEVMKFREIDSCVIAPWPQAEIEKQYKDFLGKPLDDAKVVKAAPGKVANGTLRIPGVAQWVGGQDSGATGPSGTKGPDFIMLSTQKAMLTKSQEEGKYMLSIFVLDAAVNCGSGAHNTFSIGHYAVESLPLKNCRVIPQPGAPKKND